MSGSGTGTSGNGTPGIGDGHGDGDGDGNGNGSGNGSGKRNGSLKGNVSGNGTENGKGSGWRDGGGFQYTKTQGHTFGIGYTADVVITREAPLGILDNLPLVSTSGKAKAKGTATTKRSGDPNLFAAVAMCRPRMHCFAGHHPAIQIPAAHGAAIAGTGSWKTEEAMLVKWRDGLTRDLAQPSVDRDGRGRPMMASHYGD